MNMAQSKSSWAFNNKKLPYIKFYFDKADIEDAKNKYFYKIHEKSIEKNFNKDAVINIDNYKGKIFLLSAENDNYWPSKKMSSTLIENSQNRNNLSHIILDVKGHYLLSYKESVNEIIRYLEKNRLAFT